MRKSRSENLIIYELYFDKEYLGTGTIPDLARDLKLNRRTLVNYKKGKLCLEITVDCNLFDLNKMLRERLLIYTTGYERTEIRYLDEYDQIEVDKDIVNLGRWIMNEITED